MLAKVRTNCRMYSNENYEEAIALDSAIQDTIEYVRSSNYSHEFFHDNDVFDFSVKHNLKILGRKALGKQ